MGACCSLFGIRITFQIKNAHYHLYCNLKFISGTFETCKCLLKVQNLDRVFKESGKLV